MHKAVLIQEVVKNFDAAVDADHQLSAAAQDSREAALPTATATATTTALAGQSADTPLVKGL